MWSCSSYTDMTEYVSLDEGYLDVTGSANLFGGAKNIGIKIKEGSNMPVQKNKFPILEYDTEKNGVIRPDRNDRNKLPELCLLTFFGEVLNDFIIKNKAEEISCYNSEMGKYPIFKVKYKNVEICLVQAVVGSASIAMMADMLFGCGVTTIIACGGCGVLTDIPAGDVIIPISALRDEGASYHYLPPSREIILNKNIIRIIKNTMEKLQTPYIEAKTWTTDAFYRETPDMITYRKEEGCTVVEMECATLAAVSEFRGAYFGQLLYSGDILTDFEHYDERKWVDNMNVREKLFYLSLEVLINSVERR